MKPRKRKCRHCKAWYKPQSSFQKACSVPCAIEVVKVQKQKKQKQEDDKTRERLKPRSKWLREAQTIFNKYIRERDKGRPCISCGEHHHGQYHAGHFYTTAARPDLRFNEDNCHLQCSVCNNHKSGNIHGYRENLLLKIGADRIDNLVSVGKSDWGIEDIKEIKLIYNKKLKDLKNDRLCE